MPWQKGKSGNGKGRPPKSRVLAQALRETGSHDSYGDLSNQQLLARMVWEGLAMGTVSFASGKTLDLDGKEWLELVKWVHAHVDGSYQPETEEGEAPEEPEAAEAPRPLSWRPISPAEKIAETTRNRREYEAEYARLMARTQQNRIAAPEEEDDQDDQNNPGNSMIAHWN